MKPYGQFCPVAKAAEVFCERWTPLILRDLAIGASRFSELQRGVPLADIAFTEAKATRKGGDRAAAHGAGRRRVDLSSQPGR